MTSDKEIIIRPTLKERTYGGYYFLQFFCNNCGHPESRFRSYVDVMIKKGKEIDKNKKFICPNCGCSTLHK